MTNLKMFSIIRKNFTLEYLVNVLFQFQLLALLNRDKSLNFTSSLPTLVLRRNFEMQQYF